MKNKSRLLFLLLMLDTMAFAGGMELEQPKATNPWVPYIGVFSGDYSVDFAYGANYFGRTGGLGASGRNTAFRNDLFQQGYSIGGQAGIQYQP